ncbi:MAG: hypothetical protein OHK0039_25200 [Bacteroidia bacterium]
MDIQQLRRYIAEGKLRAALDALLATPGRPFGQEAIQLAARLSRIEQSERMGVASPSELNVERNKITHALLSLLTDDMPIAVPDPREAAPATQTRILFIAANPSNESRLATDQEYRLIKGEMERGAQRDRFTFLKPQLAATIGELIRAMNDKPQIVHFSGHGTTAGLLITGENNEAQLVQPAALKRLFSPLKGHTQVVLFNACYSAAQAEEISRFGMYVVGYREPVGDRAAIGFAQGLYNGLGEGKAFEEAFNDAMIMLIQAASHYADIVEVWKDGQRLAL